MLTNLYLSKINILLAVALIDNINIPDITTSEKLCTSKCERRKKKTFIEDGIATDLLKTTEECFHTG